MASRAPKKVNPNAIRVRDEALVRVINGATKAAVHVDLKKQASKRACRTRGKEADRE